MSDELTIHEIEREVQKRIDRIQARVSNEDLPQESRFKWGHALTQMKQVLAWIDKRIDETVIS